MGKGRYGPLGFAATKRIRQREARGLRGKRRKRGSSLFSLSAPEMAQLLVESLQASVDRGSQQKIIIFRKQLRLRTCLFRLETKGTPKLPRACNKGTSPSQIPDDR